MKNENAKYEITKVCNPYCEPCAKAHRAMENLLESGKVNLRIIFTATVNEDDHRSKPVRHFLAINAKGNNVKTRKALNQWYNHKNKDYARFAKDYPVGKILLQQDKSINAMSAWCISEKIAYTPTIFINGFKLPNEYSINDLEEILI